MNLRPARVIFLTLSFGVALSIPVKALAQEAQSGTMATTSGSSQDVDPHAKRLEHQFKSLDSNRDGSISKAEFEAAADRKFDQLDTNHDGLVSKEEFLAAKGAGVWGKSDHHYGQKWDGNATSPRSSSSASH